jgi:hypothetical protein
MNLQQIRNITVEYCVPLLYLNTGITFQDGTSILEFVSYFISEVTDNILELGL